MKDIRKPKKSHDFHVRITEELRNKIERLRFHNFPVSFIAIGAIEKAVNRTIRRHNVPELPKDAAQIDVAHSSHINRTSFPEKKA